MRMIIAALLVASLVGLAFAAGLHVQGLPGLATGRTNVIATLLTASLGMGILTGFVAWRVSARGSAGCWKRALDARAAWIDFAMLGAVLYAGACFPIVGWLTRRGSSAHGDAIVFGAVLMAFYAVLAGTANALWIAQGLTSIETDGERHFTAIDEQDLSASERQSSETAHSNTRLGGGKRA